MQNISSSGTNISDKPVSAAPRKKVYVGMSGGVDSSVSAALLKEQGCDVTGVFIKVWQPDSTDCGWKDERRDAMRVCAVLDIPFLTLDFSERYKKEVVDYMIEEYRLGRTPNPDVMCNRHVKFGSFLDEAKARGADYVATGHYARNEFDSETQSWFLKEGADASKDQSYFLWTLASDDLKRVLFPIGHLQKSEVRDLAKKFSLPVFDKKDSQGVCFIGHLDMKSFLKEHIETRKGNVLDANGTIIGEHDGAALYTHGERHGFSIFTDTAAREPHYVVKKDLEKNTITVLPESEYRKDSAAMRHATANLTRCLFSEAVRKKVGEFDNKADGGAEIACGVRVRYRQAKQKCVVTGIDLNAGTAVLAFAEPQSAIAPGQSAVFYIDEVCIGGGILE